MDIVWAALGICAIVVFVFYVLALHWQKMLRQQSLAIRRLTSRLEDLEEMADPQFRRRVSDAAPAPLQQVFTFAFRLNDSFWKESLHLAPAEFNFARSMATVVGSIKIERWRGHTVIAIREALPESKSAGWQTRTLELYSPGGSSLDTILWEVALRRPQGSAERPPALELALRQNSLELRCSSPPLSPNGRNGGTDDTILLRVPLDAALLAQFRSHNPLENTGNGNGMEGAFYAHQEESLGLEWQVWTHDLSKKAEWEQWKILDASCAPDTKLA
jgi:hypothetical protein